MQDISDQIVFRLSDEDKEVVAQLLAKTGLNYTSILRLAIRRLAEAEGLDVTSRKPPQGSGSNAAD